MKATLKKTDIADYYFGLLSNLNEESKIMLINRLKESLKTPTKNENTPLKSLYGSFQSNQTAEEIISEIRSLRNFNRNIEEL